MARSEARVTVDIWAEESDFRLLSPDAQWMYFFLLSQPDLGHTGVLALRERRWARAAAGLTPTSISDRLSELEAARYVVIDYDTEELLVRSLIRRDKVYRQPNVLRNAIDQLAHVVSPMILASIAAELDRIADEPMTDASRAVVAEMRAAVAKAAAWNPSANPSPNPSANPSRNPTDDPQDIDGNPTDSTPGDRGVVTEVSSASPYPVPRSPDPVPRRTPSESETRASARPDSTKGCRLPDDFAITEAMTEWARENTPEVDSRRETEKFINYWRSVPGAKGRKLDWRATWRNWMLRAAEYAPARASPNGTPPAMSTTERKVAAALEAGRTAQAFLEQQQRLEITP